MLVDSHCHLDRLDLSIFDGDLEAALQNAADHDVSHMLCVCIDMDNFADVVAIAMAHDNIFASVGVHPNEQNSRDPEAGELVSLADNDRIVAIGETGLDYFRSNGDLSWQQDRFRHHIAAARQTGKPLIIHTRDAREDTLNIMRTEGASDAGGVMHCFAEDWPTARAALDMGFYISFSGIVTFNSARELKEVAKRVPLDRILIETDSPYLAPMPHRGKPNQPAWVKYVAEHIAQLRGEDYENIAESTTTNFFTLFSGAIRQ
ncbi:MAG: TatD family hydrolase [Gammaproteobacteria bacterium]|nr:MAG: TatD family hydrolase [Gammaproteobacteria bacterium]